MLHPHFINHCTSHLTHFWTPLPCFCELYWCLDCAVMCEIMNHCLLNAIQVLSHNMCHKHSSHLMGKVMAVTWLTFLNPNDPKIMVMPNGANYHRDNIQCWVKPLSAFLSLSKVSVLCMSLGLHEVATFYIQAIMHTYLHTRPYACVGLTYAHPNIKRFLLN